MATGEFQESKHPRNEAGEFEPVAHLTGTELHSEEHPELTPENVVAAAHKWFQANLQGKELELQGGGTARVSGKSWREIKRGMKSDIDKARLIPAISQILKHGSRSKPTELHKERSDGIKRFHYFDGHVRIGNTVHHAKVDVGEREDGQLVYHLWKNVEAKKQNPPTVSPRLRAQGAEGSATDEIAGCGPIIDEEGDEINLEILASTPMPLKSGDKVVSAAGILYRASDTGRVLLLMRPRDAENGGMWAFPAGHIEPGETPAQAAARESQEEIGHAPVALRQLKSTVEGFVLFFCAEPEFAPVLNEESDGFLWADPKTLPSPLHPGIFEAVGQYGQDMSQQFQSDLFDALDESSRRFDYNGWFTVDSNPLSKVGVFEYLGRSVDPAADPDHMVMVYRPPEELGSPDTIESFKLLPWIDDHVMLGSEEAGLMPAERKGIQGVIGEQVYFDQDSGTLFGNIKVMSEAMANLISTGKKELSCGYRCTYERADGITPDGKPYQYVQRNIRGNHLALVDSGRMGPEVHVLDRLDEGKEPPVADEKKDGEAKGGLTLDEAKEHLKTILPIIAEMQKLLGGAGESKADGVPTNANGGEKKPAVQEKDDDDEESKDSDESKPGASDPKEKAEEEAKAGMDAIERRVEARIAAKASLYGDLSAVVGAFDHSEMTIEAMATYGCDKLEIKPTGTDPVAYLRGYLSAKGKHQPAPASAMDKKSSVGFMDKYLSGSKE